MPCKIIYLERRPITVPWPLCSLVCLFLMIFLSIPPQSVFSHFILKRKSVLKSLFQVFCLYTNYLLSVHIPFFRAYTTKILRLQKTLSIILVTTLKCPGLSYLQFILLCKILTTHVIWVQIFYVVHLTLPEKQLFSTLKIAFHFLWWYFSIIIHWENVSQKSVTPLSFHQQIYFFTCKSSQLIFPPIIIKEVFLLVLFSPFQSWFWDSLFSEWIIYFWWWFFIFWNFNHFFSLLSLPPW